VERFPCASRSLIGSSCFCRKHFFISGANPKKCVAKISSLLDHQLCEGIPFDQPSLFRPWPSGRDNFKAVRGLDIWKFCLVLCLQNLWFISLKILATFIHVVGVFLPRKFKRISENVKFVSWRNKILSSNQSLQGRVLEISPCRISEK